MANILIIRTSAMGDVAMLVPVVSSVAAQYPQDRFYVLTRKAYTPLFKDLGFNITTISFDPKRKHKGVTGTLKLIFKLLSYPFTHVADEHDVLRSKLIRYALFLKFCKIAVIDKGRKEKQNMIINRDLSPLKPTIGRYLDVFKKLGFPTELSFTNFFTFNKRDLSLLKDIIHTPKQGKWIGIAPFAKHKGKIYPLEKMEKVTKTLSKQENTTIFLFGAGREEKEILDTWAGQNTNIINVSDKLKLEKEMILMSYLDVMISMDSTNMHLASLVEVPVVSVWGTTHPSAGFYGFKQNPGNIIQVDLECRPCSVYGNVPCKRGDYACLYWIEENRIEKKVNSILQEK